MKRVLLITFLLIATIVHAQDLYVYRQNDYQPVLHAEGFRCVVFASQDIEVRTTDGKSQFVPYEQFDYIRFTPTPFPAGIMEILTSEGSTRRVYSITGQQVNRDLKTLPAGVYLLHRTHGDKEIVTKILKK